jgi:hypothetical protein
MLARRIAEIIACQKAINFISNLPVYRRGGTVIKIDSTQFLTPLYYCISLISVSLLPASIHEGFGI